MSGKLPAFKLRERRFDKTVREIACSLCRGDLGYPKQRRSGSLPGYSLPGFCPQGFWWTLNRGLTFEAEDRPFQLGIGLLVVAIVDPQHVRDGSGPPGHRLCESRLFAGLSGLDFGADPYIWIHGHGQVPLRLVQFTPICERIRKVLYAATLVIVIGAIVS